MTEIQERLNVPEEDVMRLTHSLSCAKYKILNKSPASRTVAKTDVFSMNKKFTDKMRRIRVSLSCSKLTTPAVVQPSHAGFFLWNTNILATAICVCGPTAWACNLRETSVFCILSVVLHH